MNKRVFAIIVTAIFAMSLSACGNNTGSAGSSPGSTTVSSSSASSEGGNSSDSATSASDSAGLSYANDTSSRTSAAGGAIGDEGDLDDVEHSGSSTPNASTESMAVPDYCDKMQDCYDRLVAAMDATHDAEAAGDVEAAQIAKQQSDDAYGEVLRTKAPAEAKDVDYRMRQAAASMNLLAAFYEDATIAKSEGDENRYEEDMSEIMGVINDVNTTSANLSTALKELTATYQ